MNIDLFNTIKHLGSGIVAVTILDILGSISSRKLNYKYVYLAPVSFLIYGLIGYQGREIATLPLTLFIVCLVGMYDGTVGWWLSVVLNANFADRGEHAKAVSKSSRIASMILMSGFFGLIGFIIGGFLGQG
jgi:hypothetical protein